MRPCILLLTLLAVLAGCKPEDRRHSGWSARSSSIPNPSAKTASDRRGQAALRERSVVPRRGKVLSGSLMSELGSSKATRWRRSTPRIIRTACARRKRTSASAEAALVERAGHGGAPSQAVEGRLDAEATYDTALRNLQAAEAGSRLPGPISTSPATSSITPTLKADFDGVITAVGAEAGQNVNAGQMVVKLARPDDKDGVFNIAETAFADVSDAHPRSSSGRCPTRT